MKFRCYCGNVIRDQTDMLNYKANFISDQDFDDLMEKIELNVNKMVEALNDEKELIKWRENYFGKQYSQEDNAPDLLKWILWDLYGKYSRQIYQCNECGRLFAEDLNDNLNCYKLETKSDSKNILSSIEGESWKGFLQAEWYSNGILEHEPIGFLFYNHVLRHTEEFVDWDSLHKRYFELFEQLKTKNVLRSAFLRKDGKQLHEWKFND